MRHESSPSCGGFAERAVLGLAGELSFSWREGARDGALVPDTGLRLQHRVAWDFGFGIVREWLSDGRGLFCIRVGDGFADQPGAQSAEDLERALVLFHLETALQAEAYERQMLLHMLVAPNPAGFAARAARVLRRPISLQSPPKDALESLLKSAAP